MRIALFVLAIAISGCSSSPEATDTRRPCSREGEGVGGKLVDSRCCEGLTRIRAVLDRPQCELSGIDAFVCTHCGDGVCGPGERTCNCPSDCK